MSSKKSAKPKIKKYFHWGENKPPIYYREHTSDMHIINSALINQQEYIFPNISEEFDPEIVYDIGANIGVVTAIFANLYPKAKIHCFEPQADNFELLKKNAEGYPNIMLHNVGLGATSGSKKLWPSDDPTNFGGYSNFIESGEPIECTILDVKRAVASYGVPDIIKIDVEGAECEILRNFPNLNLCSWIAGELHSEDAEYLMLHTLSTHFRLALARGFYDKMWHFHAVNKEWKDFGQAKTKEPDVEGKKHLEAVPETPQNEGSTTT